MNPEPWKKLGVEACAMLAELYMRGTDPIPSGKRETNIYIYNGQIYIYITDKYIYIYNGQIYI